LASWPLAWRLPCPALEEAKLVLVIKLGWLGLAGSIYRAVRQLDEKFMAVPNSLGLFSLVSLSSN